MDGEMIQEVASRLPLAEAVLRMFEEVGSPDFLQDVFQRHRGRSYQLEISFPLFVHLIADALLEHDGSGRKSFQRSIQAGDLQASEQAAYGKLRRVPLSLSMGWLRETSAQLRQAFPVACVCTWPTAGMAT